jgi:hypothetical protein
MSWIKFHTLRPENLPQDRRFRPVRQFGRQFLQQGGNAITDSLELGETRRCGAGARIDDFLLPRVQVRHIARKFTA